MGWVRWEVGAMKPAYGALILAVVLLVWPPAAPAASKSPDGRRDLARIDYEYQVSNGPVLAGDSVVWVEGSRTVKRARPGLKPRVVPVPQPVAGPIGLDGSSTRLLVSRTLGVGTKYGFSASSHEVHVGSASGEGFEHIQTCGRYEPFSSAVDGDVVAFFDCKGEQLHIRDLSQPSHPDTIIPLSPKPYTIRGLQLAGRYVAWHEETPSPGQTDTIRVLDWITGSETLRVNQVPTPENSQARITGFDVQGDGKIAVAYFGSVGTPVRSIAWHQPGSLTGQPLGVDRPDLNAPKLAADRVATTSTRRSRPKHSFGTAPLGQSFRPVAYFVTGGVRSYDFDGTRLAWIEFRCGGLFVTFLPEITQAKAISRDPCPEVVVVTREVRERNGFFELRARCQAKSVCRGELEAIDAYSSRLVGDGQFRIRARKTETVRLRTREFALARFKHRTSFRTVVRVQGKIRSGDRFFEETPLRLRRPR